MKDSTALKELLRKVRKIAVERGTTLTALVRAPSEELTSQLVKAEGARGFGADVPPASDPSGWDPTSHIALSGAPKRAPRVVQEATSGRRTAEAAVPTCSFFEAQHHVQDCRASSTNPKNVRLTLHRIGIWLLPNPT